MNHKTGFFKLQNRLNKGATEDYGNIDKDVASEAINKALSNWIRRQYHGNNLYKEGAEESRQRVDDLQPLLVPNKVLSTTKYKNYSDTSRIPKDYLYINRIYFYDTVSDECEDRYVLAPLLTEEANIDVILKHEGKKPSREFEQCLYTILSNKFRIYDNNIFNPKEVILVYYKKPKYINLSLPLEEFEFKDDVMEVVLDETAKIISGDIESPQIQRLEKSVEDNN